MPQIRLAGASRSHIISANHDFDLAFSLQASILCEDAALQSGSDDLFSLSPLTSPDCTPPSSPRIAPISYPLAPDNSAAECQSASFQHPPPSTKVPTSSVQQATSAEKKVLPTPSRKAKNRKAMSKVASHAQRKKKRAAAEAGFGHYVLRDKVVERYVDHSNPVRCQMATEKAPIQNTGFVAEDDGTRSRKEFRLDELVGQQTKFKFQLVEWDGCTPTPIIDRSQRIVAVLAGHPNVDDWPQVRQQAADALEERRIRCDIPLNKRKHRRGQFVALQCGVSHGGGQKRPCNMANNVQNGKIINELNELSSFKRMAGFASACMSAWAPELYRYYADNMGALYTNDTSLKLIFPSCIFSAATYNFGPRTVCYKHKDFNNLTFGWCAVWSLGAFDPRTGGHLVLWDCHLVIQFPPGSMILLPSAIVAHSNVHIAAHEHRYSFALYTAGALFRWVANDFMTAELHRAKLSPEQLDVERQKNASRWIDGLSLLPKLHVCSDP